jgi:integrase
MQVTSEGPVRITKATIEAAWRRRSRDNRLIIRDKECRGLSLIVNPTSMAWTCAYRPRGADAVTGKRWPNKTVTLGNPASLSPEDARFEANKIKGQAAAGNDRAAEKKARAAAERRKRHATLGRLLEEYKAALPKRTKLRGAGRPSPGYVQEEIAQVQLALTEMDAADRPAADLSDQDVRKLLSGSGGVATARKRFGALSRFFDWAQDAGHVQANPCTLIGRSRRPKAPQARSNFLTLPELAWLWHAAEGLREPVWRDLVRFLIAIPARRNEAARLDWSHLDLAAPEWRQLGRLTKNRDPHRLHLHLLALQVLRVRQECFAAAQANGDPEKAARILAAGPPRSGLVFPAPESGKAVDTFSDIKNELIDATGERNGEGDSNRKHDTKLTGWTWHDFRRSFATALGEAGIAESVADAVLNHRQSGTRGGVLGVYQRATRWPEQKRAMELWGRMLADAIEGRNTGAEVIAMPAAS